MATRNAKDRCRRIVAMVLTILAIGVLGLWADSYRTRTLPPLTPKEQAFFDSLSLQLVPFSDSTALIGINYSHHTTDRVIYRIRTCQGNLSLELDTGIVTGTPIKPIDLSLGHFSMGQWVWTSSIIWGEDGEPDIHDEYHVREVSLPFWALFLMLAMQPVVWFVTGPLKRNRRRRRGQCTTCGYDLSRSPDRCPECGTAKQVAQPAS